jgi:GNAT superfamily N-acetyltransferase
MTEIITPQARAEHARLDAVRAGVGAASLEALAMAEAPFAPLPDGYRYEAVSDASSREVAGLLRQVEMGAGVKDDYLADRNAYVRSGGADTFDIGVRDSEGNLIGFGSVIYKGANGELTDFVVSPRHQGRGVGRAILDARLRFAGGAGLSSLYSAMLEPTNTLRSYYERRGFRKLPTGELARGPSPQPLEALIEAGRAQAWLHAFRQRLLS